MKVKILIFAGLLLLVAGKTNAQCGVATNLAHQFSNEINYFTWDPVSNAVQYDLMIVETNSFSAPELLVQLTTNSFSTPGGVLSATYDYWIVTTCQNGDISTSAPLTFTIPCPEPTNLSTTGITQTSATLNWSNPYATNLMYERGVALAYRPLGGSWITITPYTLASTYALSNLTPGTTYEWCVNLDCPYFDSAPVIGTFTTLNATCMAPASQNLLELTNTTAKLNWSGVSNAETYSIQYKLAGSSTWTTINTTNNNTTYNLTGLSLNTQYQWRVASNCSYGQSSYSAITSFVTNCVDMNNSVSYLQYGQVKTVIRTSGADPNGYFNYFAPVDAQAGSTVTVKVRAGFNGGNSAHSFAIYLDSNRNGQFDANEKVGGNYLINNTSLKTYNITVPANASPGHARLRLVLLKQNQGINMSACVPAGALGETEDYWLNVTAPASFAPENAMDKPATNEEITLRNEEEYPPMEVKLSPNPTSGDFIISSNNGLLSYTVFRTDGTLIRNEQLDDAPTLVYVQLEVVPDEIYFVKVTDVYGASSVHKLVVNN